MSEAARSRQVCRIAGAVAAIFALAATADPPAASAQGANVTASSAPAAAPAPATADASAVSEFTLANGLRVVVVPDHRVPVVTHMVWYAVGAADEGPDEHGVAHYLEHMMFKGTAAYPKGELDRFVTRRGGWHNATTSMDNTNYFQRLPKSALPHVMAMEADRMVNLRIDDADVASERAVVLEEYRRNEVSITMGIDKMIRAALYEGHPKARTTIGTESEIKALSGATAQRFYERFYGPNRATVVVAGDVTEAEVRTLAVATYGQVPARPGLAPRVVGAIPVAAVSQRIEASHERATAVRVSRVLSRHRRHCGVPARRERCKSFRLHRRRRNDEPDASAADQRAHGVDQRRLRLLLFEAGGDLLVRGMGAGRRRCGGTGEGVRGRARRSRPWRRDR